MGSLDAGPGACLPAAEALPCATVNHDLIAWRCRARLEQPGARFSTRVAQATRLHRSATRRPEQQRLAHETAPQTGSGRPCPSARSRRVGRRDRLVACATQEGSFKHAPKTRSGGCRRRAPRWAICAPLGRGRALRWFISRLSVVFCGVLVSASHGLAAADASAPFPPVSELPVKATLPDPLVMFNGERVATATDWVARRRPELKALFQHYMYGNPPPAPARIEWAVERQDPVCLEGKATKKEIRITFGPSNSPPIHLLVVVPNARRAPAPVVLGRPSRRHTRRR